MHRFRLPVLALCCLPVLSSAADAEAPLQCRPAAEAETPELFEPARGEPLSYDEQRDLRLLFAAAEGRWSGSAVDRVCMVAGHTKAREFRAELKLTSTREGLRIAGEYRQVSSGATWRFNRRLFLTPEGLRVDQRSRVGEVELTGAARDALSYVQRYRTVHSFPAEGAGPPGAGGTPGPGAAAGTSNVVSESGAIPTEPPPKRRSVQREERFSLQLGGSRHLVLVQDFFIQGTYTGTMRWDLRRD